jgi:PPE-repeat protein
VDLAVLPPEINSARMYTAAGAGATMSPVEIEVNRASGSTLLVTNVFGQNTSPIATRPHADPLHATRRLAADVIES